jgi:hypothetical protein
VGSFTKLKSNKMSKLQELTDKLKQTYMNEEQQIELSNFCSNRWNEVNDKPCDKCDKEVIINILQHYVDTGGDVAGGYIHCVPNIIKFVNDRFNLLQSFHTQLKSVGLYKMDLLEFLLTQYREYIFQTQND